MLGILLVAVAVGLSNFAAAIGIGISGVDAAVRIRIVVVFGLFEATMPLVGLLLGRQFSGDLGSASAYVGGGLLIAIGIYTLLQARRQTEESSIPMGNGRLVLAGAALSIDNLVVGFALGAYKVSVVLAAVVIAVVSVGLSLIGLELGNRLGVVVEKWSEEIGGGILILVGVAIACGII